MGVRRLGVGRLGLHAKPPWQRMNQRCSEIIVFCSVYRTFIITVMRSIYRTRIDRALARDIALVCLAVGLVAVSYGAIAVASGFPLWLPMVQSVLVLAGSSELLFVGLVGAGGNPVAVAFAGLLVNARHVPYGLALEPGVTGNGWRRLLGTHVMND